MPAIRPQPGEMIKKLKPVASAIVVAAPSPAVIEAPFAMSVRIPRQRMVAAMMASAAAIAAMVTGIGNQTTVNVIVGRAPGHDLLRDVIKFALIPN